LVAIDSQSGPPGVRVNGLIDGHVAFGFRDEHQLLHADMFDGTSPGAILEVRLWKLARIEVGLAGLAVGLGPVDVALGCLLYDPDMPRFSHEEHADHDHDHHEHAAKPKAKKEADESSEPEGAEHADHDEAEDGE
jgi:hypothetical protein